MRQAVTVGTAGLCHSQRRRQVQPNDMPGPGNAQLRPRVQRHVPGLPTFEALRRMDVIGATVRGMLRYAFALALVSARVSEVGAVAAVFDPASEVPFGAGAEPFFSASSCFSSAQAGSMYFPVNAR